MSFDKKSFIDIYDNMAADTRRRLPEVTDFEEGSVVRSLYESFAYEMAVLYEQLDLVYQAGFIDTAEDANLDRVVAVLGIVRNEPDFATGSVTFERDKGLNEELVIPIGTLLTTEEDEKKDPPKKAYLTIEEGHITPGSASVDVRIQAEERGKKMVGDTDTVIVMPRPVPGVKSVTNKKPIRFLGRDRETDAELRQRAKQALLASGRASITSIENALLGMSGVREVRVKEDFPSGENPQGTLGKIDVYVDGLTSQNAPMLRERIDQVRAAGVYVVLKPAIAINLEGVFQIEVDQRISTDERPKLEQDVVNAIEGLVQQLGMGQSLLFSQLTSEILKVNGVKDVPHFQLTTYREDDSENSLARGKVVLTRTVKLDNDITIPANTLVRTQPGQEYLLTKDMKFTNKKPSIEAEVKAVKTGRSGELLRTGDAIAWEPLQLEGGVYTTVINVINDQPLYIEYAQGSVNLTRTNKLGQGLTLPKGTIVHTNQGNEFELSADIRFRQYEASVAAGVQATQPGRAGELARTEDEINWSEMQVKSPIYTVNVSASNTAPIKIPTGSTDNIATGAVTLTRTKTGEPLLIPSGTSLRVQDSNTLRHEFLLKDDILFPATDETMKADVYAGVSGAAGELNASTDAAWESLKIPSPDSTNITLKNEQPINLNRTPPPGAGDNIAFGKLMLKRSPGEKEILPLAAGTIFSAGTERNFILAANAQFPENTQDIDVDVYAVQAGHENQVEANASWQELGLESVNMLKVTNKETIQIVRETYAPNQRRIDTQILERLVPESIRVASEQKPLRVRVQVKLETPKDDRKKQREEIDTAVKGFFAGLKVGESFVFVKTDLEKVIEKPAGGGFAVRLVSLPFQGLAPKDDFQIDVSFVEKPEAEIIFVYSNRLELTGNLTLILPLTATNDDKLSAIGAARQAIGDYLDALAPEEDIDLQKVQDVAAGIEKVLRVVFQPEACTVLDAAGKIVDSRIKDHVVDIDIFEKLFLSDTQFVIKAQ